MPSSIFACVASGKATLAELDTVYGVMDLHDMLEMAAVEAHNARAIAAHRRREAGD